ncbi:MAG: YraN family protein [Bacteroidales bacterium]|jgi:putative endonuclease|nr:YraN family protein [Bacteroidales bacterium]
MENNKSFGDKGERIALEYLIEKKYLILETNYKSGRNEVDIIAKHRGDIVFIEVKTRATEVFIHPEEAVNLEKQRSIISVANNYILKNNIFANARFDIISIILNEKIEINHIENAFMPMPR